MATATEKQGVEVVVVDANGFVKAFEGRRTSGSWSSDLRSGEEFLRRIAAGSAHSGFLNSFVFGGEGMAWRRNRFDPVDHRLPASDTSSPAWRRSVAWAFEDPAPGREPSLADLVRDAAEGEPLSCKVHALFHVRDAVLEATARTRPWIVRLPLPLLGRVLGLGAVPSAEDLAGVMTAYDAGRWPSDARTIARFDAMAKTEGMMADPTVFLSMSAHLPPEWIEALPGGHADLARMSPVLRTLLPEGVSGARNLLNGCAGRLDVFLPAALGIDAEKDARTKVGEIRDLMEFLGVRLVAPIAGMALRRNPAILDIVHVVAKRLVTPDGNLRRLREKSDLWHADTSAFSGRGRNSDATWPAILPPYAAGGGIDVVGLVSAADLRDEGDAMAHCVATYDGRCAVGRSFVFSVRRRTKGGFERLSTVELVRNDDGDFETTQHLAHRNGRPPDDAVRAVAKWTGAISSGRLKPDAEASAWFDRIGETENMDVGRSAREIDPSDYAGLILPAYSSMGAEEFASAVRAMVDVAREEARTNADPRAPRAGWSGRRRR